MNQSQQIRHALRASAWAAVLLGSLLAVADAGFGPAQGGGGSGGAASGWSYSSPVVSLATATDKVQIGTPSGGSGIKAEVNGDATSPHIWWQTGPSGHFELSTSSEDNYILGNDSGIAIGNNTGDVIKVYPNGDTSLNATGSALAQNATAGFTYLPQCLVGAPSGTPTSRTGAIPFVVGGNNHVYGYLGGAWQQIDGSFSPTPVNHITSLISGNADMWGMCSDATGDFLYVADHNNRGVWKIRSSDHTMIGFCSFGGTYDVYGVAVDGAGDIWASCDGTWALRKIDHSTFTATAVNIALPGKGDAVQYDDAGFVWVACDTSNDVVVVNTSTNTLVATLATPGTAQNLADDGAGSMWVLNRSVSSVSRFSISGQSLTTTVAITASRPEAIAAGGGFVVCGDNNSGTISVVSAASNTEVGVLAANGIGLGCGLGGAYDGAHWWIPLETGGQLVEIDCAIPQVVNQIVCGSTAQPCEGVCWDHHSTVWGVSKGTFTVFPFHK